MQCLQSGILPGVATLGGDINDEQHLACVGFERGILAVDVFERDVTHVRISGDGDGGHEQGKEEGFHGGEEIRTEWPTKHTK